MKKRIMEDLLKYLSQGFTLEQSQELVIEMNRQKTIKIMQAVLKKCNVPTEQQIESKKEIKDINDFKTCELVQELMQRDGVEIKVAEPYQDMDVSVNGPAVVLIVID